MGRDGQVTEEVSQVHVRTMTYNVGFFFIEEGHEDQEGELPAGEAADTQVSAFFFNF